MKKLVYISHPSGGLSENTLDIEKIVSELYKNQEIAQKYCLVSPVHCYGFMYHDVDYYKGLEFCTDLLEHCDEIWVFGEWQSSKGCKAEVELAEKLGIKTRFLGYSNNIDTVISAKLYKDNTTYITPSKPRELKPNTTLYACIKQSKCDRITEALNNSDNTKLRNIIFYEDLNKAIEKTKGRDNAYALMELIVNRDKEFDINDNKDARQFNQFMMQNNSMNKFFESEVDAFNEFLEYNKDKISIVRRIIVPTDGKSNGTIISDNNKVIYQIINNDCIVEHKIYNNYTIKNSDRVIICGNVF